VPEEIGAETDSREPRDRPHPIRVPRIVWVIVALVGGVVAGLSLVRWLDDPPASDADVGELTEPTWTLPAGTPPAALTVATGLWGLDEVDTGGGVDAVAGGVAAADLDRDGDLDLVVANGDALIIPWEGGSFGTPIDLGLSAAVAVTASDVDGDGWVDVLVARRGTDDSVVWGGEWIGTRSTPPQPTPLGSGSRSSALIAAELSGDDRIDILRVGLGTGDGQPDVVWVADPMQSRAFGAVVLPSSDRPSFAAELADVDADGLIDIWITRDIGWKTGSDSLLSRRGDPAGPWVDIAEELGTALAVDGMGVTIADLDGDGALDAYVSDIGDNELLVRRGAGFVPLDESGSARIRPPGSGRSTVSSSWASGVADINLDGNIDLVVVNGGFPDGGVPNKIPGTAIALDESPAIFIGDGTGRFVDVMPGLDLDISVVGRGMSVADLDGDGDDDIVLMDHDGGLTALRNDTTGLSVTVRTDASCRTAGAVVDVAGADGAYRTLLAPNTYNGAHGTDAVVGTSGRPVTITLRPDIDVVLSREVPASVERTVETFNC
jgi:hypothetical protein